MSLARSRAGEWKLDPERVGILGFSAGGETAVLTSLFTNRTYTAVDGADEQSFRPDFTVLIYAAGVVDRKSLALRDYVTVTSNAPPTFLAHAWDDGVPVQNPVTLFSELKKAGVPADLHVFARGGHGYGLRETELPVTRWWPRLCEDWMRDRGLLERR